VNESFNRFVEGEGGSSAAGGRRVQTPLDESKKDFWDSFADSASTATSGRRSMTQAPLDETKKDFWDSFGAPAESSVPKPTASAIGTKAMSGNAGAGGANKKDDDWDKW